MITVAIGIGTAMGAIIIFIAARYTHNKCADIQQETVRTILGTLLPKPLSDEFLARVIGQVDEYLGKGRW